MIATKELLIEGASTLMGKNSSNLSDDGFDASANMAMLELGWSFPLDHPLKEMWALNRTIRHGLVILQIESAHKFRYKDIFLQNRFAQYTVLIEKMDKDYAQAVEDNPDLFMGSVFVNQDTLGEAFSFYIPNERDYDDLGRPKE